MNKKILLGFIGLVMIISPVLADSFVPEFDKMLKIRCDFEEQTYDSNNTLLTTSNRFRIYRLDDEFSKIYLQKEPIDKVSYYGLDKIVFSLQSMSDDFITMSKTTIDRNASEYHSESTITYDNPYLGTGYSKSFGTCRAIY